MLKYLHKAIVLMYDWRNNYLNMKKEFAIIILNYNSKDIVYECINSLTKFKLECRIIIVDNNSTDDSYKCLCEKYKTNQYINVIKSNENGGYSKGNNIGIRYALMNYPDIKYISIMNPDVIIENRSTFTECIKCLKEDDQLAAIIPKMIYKGKVDINQSGWKLPSYKEILFSNSTILFKIRKKNNNIEVNKKKNLLYVEVIHGSFFIMKVDVLKKIGLLDENVFLYYEENILGYKCKELGYKLAVNLKECYIHNHIDKSSNLKYARTVTKRLFKSEMYYIKKYKKCNFLEIIGLYIVHYLNLYVELPIIKGIKKLQLFIQKHSYKKVC